MHVLGIISFKRLHMIVKDLPRQYSLSPLLQFQCYMSIGIYMVSSNNVTIGIDQENITIVD